MMGSIVSFSKFLTSLERAEITETNLRTDPISTTIQAKSKLSYGDRFNCSFFFLSYGICLLEK